MKTIKSYTDLEQSKKLTKILPLESADMCYHFIEINKTPLCVRWEKVHDDEKDNSLPAWSLAALLDYLSANFHTDIRYLDNYWELDCRVQFAYGKELVDACYEMILKLHELKML